MQLRSRVFHNYVKLQEHPKMTEQIILNNSHIILQIVYVKSICKFTTINIFNTYETRQI